MIPAEAALAVGIALSMLAFSFWRGATALTISFVAGYLLLPSAAAINFQGLPPLDKMRAIWLGAALGTLIFQPGALGRLRWHPADGVMLAAIALHGYSSIANGLGYWDAQSVSVNVVLKATLPYLLARIHFRSVDDLAGLGKALFWGAVLYAPLAVWEFRMSPQFHSIVYGFFPHSWAQHVRWGFHRPVVFLGHGLAVGGLFSGALLIGIVLLRRGLLRWQLPLPVWFAVAGVGAGLAVTMSAGPWLAVPVGWVLLRWAKRRRWVPIAAGIPGVVWLAVVFTTGSDWSWMTRPFEAIGATERAASLQYRIDAMTEYAANIRQRPWFGHAGWGQGLIEGRATDSKALVLLLKNGLVGALLWYIWLFWLAWAGVRAADRAGTSAEREVILLFACLIGMGITTQIYGTAGSSIPVSLIGGAVTGLAVVRPGVRSARGRVIRIAVARREVYRHDRTRSVVHGEVPLGD